MTHTISNSRAACIEKYVITRIVGRSHLPVRRTPDMLGIPRATFYRLLSVMLYITTWQRHDQFQSGEVLTWQDGAASHDDQTIGIGGAH